VPGLLFVADIAGLTREALAALGGCGFDYCLSSLAWWDFRAAWLSEEYEAASRVAPILARVGAEGVPSGIGARRARYAVAAVAGGLFGGLSVAASGTKTVPVPLAVSGAKWETTQVTDKVTGATASISYTKELWGDSFAVLVDHIPVGTTCELWVVHPDGTRTQVAAWTTAQDEGKVWYSGSMASSAQPISQFQITAGNKVLLTATPT